MVTLSEDVVDESIVRWRNSCVDTTLDSGLMDLLGGCSKCMSLTGVSPGDIYRDLAVLNGSFFVRPEVEGEGPPSEDVLLASSRDGRLSRSLMTLYARAQEAWGARGVPVLFLSLGTLEWWGDVTQGRRAHSPLVLVPLRMSRSASSAPYELRSAGPAVLNPALEHKLRTEMSLPLPPLPPEADIEAFLQEVRTGLAGRGWTVTSSTYLGLFDLPPMAVYHELERYRDMLVVHPVVRAIARSKGVGGEISSPLWGAGELSVLDADSSQQEAVALALSGTSFVLQGPPGTGKSQTIANMITEEIARGRTVLFVSEKRSALEAVRKRLESRGLSRYCLDLYGPHRDVHEVADELRRCLSIPLSPSIEPLPREELERCRSQLDGYVEALHQLRDGLGTSFYEVLSRLSGMRSVKELPINFPALQRLGARQMDSLQPLVADIERYAPLLSKGNEHPWADCEVGKWQLSAQSEIMRRLSDLKLSRTRLEEVLGAICKEHDLPVPRDLKGTNQLIEHLRTVNLTHYPEESWLEQDPTPLLDLVDDMRESYKSRLERMTWVKQMYRDGVLDLDLKGMQERILNSGKVTSRLFDASYHKDMKALEDLKRGDRKLKHAQVCFELKELTEVSELVARVQKEERECADRLGRHFQGDRTDWGRTIDAINWTRDYRSRYGAQRTPGITRLLCSGPEALVGLKTKVDSLEEAALRLSTAISAVRERFDLSPLTAGRTVNEVPLEDLSEWAQRHLDHARSFQEWTELSRVRREAKEQGLEGLLALATSGKLPSEAVWEGACKRHLVLWHDLLLASDDRLRLFEQEAHERIISHYAEVDREGVERSAALVRDLLDRHRVSVLEDIAGQGRDEHAVLKGATVDGEKDALRALFASSLDSILAIKPCLMMDPRAVSTLLDPSVTLMDLAILDEASQIRVGEGIATILRAKQVVVVGDSMQLPPMSVAADGEEVERESIMDACATVLPQRSLLWHYRSQQESLFSFSNDHFYGGRLITYPSAVLDREDLGVSFVHVPGGGGEEGRFMCSEEEAAQVADLIIDHMTRRPRESLGVVAFTEPQQMAVIEELERRVAQNPELAPLLAQAREEPFFVKSLEDVQGDERDVIIFSVGYRKDPTGRKFHSFGLLNGEIGRRRLNVAITRARKHIQLVSTLLPEEIEVDAGERSVLRDYLAYAAWPGHEAPAPAAADPLLDEVQARLEARGLKVERGVGRSSTRIELAIVDDDHPGKYLLGILTDGPTYRRSGGARDRERTRIEALTALGWNLQRLWSQDWLGEPDLEVERIVSAVERSREAEVEREADAEMRPLEVLVASLAVEGMAAASDEPAAFGDEVTAVSCEGPEMDGTVLTAPTSESVELVAEVEVEPLISEEVEVTAAPPPDVAVSVPITEEPLKDLCAVYVAARLHEDPSLVYMFSQDQGAAVREALKRVVEEEGPVHLTVVRDRLKELVSVTTGKRPSHVDRLLAPAVAALEQEGRVRTEGEFLWPAGLTTLRPRRCYSLRRDIDHVCDAELEAMVRMITAKAPRMRVKRVVSDVSDLLGYKRPTAAIRKRVEDVMSVVAPRSAKESAPQDEEDAAEDDRS